MVSECVEWWQRYEQRCLSVLPAWRLTMSRGVLAMFSLKCFNTNPTRSHSTGPGNTYLISVSIVGPLVFTPQTTP